MNLPRPTDQELRGMTVNERLVMCDALDRWDDAVKRRKRDDMIVVLLSVGLSAEQAAQTTDAVLNNPRMYGF